MQTASLFKRGRGACVIFVEITEGYVIKNGKSMKLRGRGGGLGCEIPSMVGVRIFSGTTHYTFLIRSLNFVWIACV